MSLFRNVVLSAVLVGLFSGTLLSVIQSLQVDPIIFRAERFESLAPTDDAKMSTDANQHHHQADSWHPTPGAQRSTFTVIANILAATGFALLLISCMSWREEPMTLIKGGAWGLAGYVTFFLAPSIGLPPEIPGTVAASLMDRQLWWLLAVVCTGGGLSLLIFAPGFYKGVGLVLVLLPQFIGAPTAHIAGYVNSNTEAVAALEELSQRFYPATAMANAVYWLFMGIISSVFVKRFVKKQ